MYTSLNKNITFSFTYLHSFQLLVLLAYLIEINFFRLYQRNKSCNSKTSFRRDSNHCKRVPEAAKLVYANKTKESITSQKLSYQDFWQIANSVLNKDKSAIPSLFSRPKVLSSSSDKAKLFAKTFRNSNLDDSDLFTCFLFWN